MTQANITLKNHFSNISWLVKNEITNNHKICESNIIMAPDGKVIAVAHGQKVKNFKFL